MLRCSLLHERWGYGACPLGAWVRTGTWGSAGRLGQRFSRVKCSVGLEVDGKTSLPSNAVRAVTESLNRVGPVPPRAVMRSEAQRLRRQNYTDQGTVRLEAFIISNPRKPPTNQELMTSSTSRDSRVLSDQESTIVSPSRLMYTARATSSPASVTFSEFPDATRPAEFSLRQAP